LATEVTILPDPIIIKALATLQEIINQNDPILNIPAS
jgi:hypothetical protein